MWNHQTPRVAKAILVGAVGGVEWGRLSQTSNNTKSYSTQNSVVLAQKQTYG